MEAIAALLHAADTLGRADESVLVTLVKIKGSAYRRPGARMLVLPGCRTIGTISGGCLEPLVARQAWAATRNGRRAIFEIESAPEDDAWGPASGCHGTLFLLAEPIPAGARHPALEALAKIRAGDQPALLIHEFNIQPDGALLPGSLHVEAIHSGNRRPSAWREQSPTRAAFLEYIPPLPHLLICGAGDDAIPVARIAAELGWRITVVDSRARYATRDRFPAADQISTAGPAALLSAIACSNQSRDREGATMGHSPAKRSLPYGRGSDDGRQPGECDRPAALLRRNTAAVVMSHRFGDDVEYLAELLRHEAIYIGLLGPRRRAERMLAELAERPTPTHATPEQLARIFSPVGLNLGAEAPEAIALSIVAEIQAALADRDARPLTQIVGPLQMPSSTPTHASQPETPCLP